MSLALMPMPSASPHLQAPSRRRGRPIVAEDPREQARHLAVATSRLVHRRSPRRLAADHVVSERTIRRWCRLALGYDGPIAEYLRSLAKSR